MQAAVPPSVVLHLASADYDGGRLVIRRGPRLGGLGRISIICRPQTLGLRASHIEAGRLDVGFTPGDAENPEPYFYRERPAKNGAGRGRARSILTASEMLAASDPAATAFAFLTAGTP